MLDNQSNHSHLLVDGSAPFLNSGLDVNQTDSLRLDQKNASLSKLRSKDQLALLTFWTFFVLRMIAFYHDESKQPPANEKNNRFVPPDHRQLIEVKKGFKIADDGYFLSTSVGEYYGSYSTCRLLNTVPKMIELTAQRGAILIEVGGSFSAKNLAFEKCREYGIHIQNFQPERQKRLQKK